MTKNTYGSAEVQNNGLAFKKSNMKMLKKITS